MEGVCIIVVKPFIILIIGFHKVDIADSQLTNDVVAKRFAVLSVSFIGVGVKFGF